MRDPKKRNPAAPGMLPSIGATGPKSQGDGMPDHTAVPLALPYLVALYLARTHGLTGPAAVTVAHLAWLGSGA